LEVIKLLRTALVASVAWTAAAQAADCPRPGTLGTSRILTVDPAATPRVGLKSFPQTLPLGDREVVLTFDDGPWPVNTPSVLKTLAEHCTKAVFFPIGKHATYYPEILKQVAAAGHTIGSHTWSHANLNNKKLTEPQRKEEVEKGFSAVKWALGAAPAPFFRFPALQHPPETVTYLGERNIGIFSTDLDSFDFKASKAQTIVDNVMRKVDKLGKGIILMHDFQKHTGEALPELLGKLKAGGYKVVHMRAKAPVQTLPEFDEALIKDMKLPTVSNRPINSVVQTISE
jgi:peptidoglycan/xylan/chitin deacetylase (PgdA/CDA1 family)